jgi:predicted ester cyclase
MRSREQVKLFYLGMHASFSDFYQEDDEILVSGNKIVSINTTTATQTGTFGYLPPSGNDILVQGVTIYEVENGMVTKMTTYFDRLAPYQEMGFQLVMPEEG